MIAHVAVAMGLAFGPAPGHPHGTFVERVTDSKLHGQVRVCGHKRERGELVVYGLANDGTFSGEFGGVSRTVELRKGCRTVAFSVAGRVEVVPPNAGLHPYGRNLVAWPINAVEVDLVASTVRRRWELKPRGPVGDGVSASTP